MSGKGYGAVTASSDELAWMSPAAPQYRFPTNARALDDAVPRKAIDSARDRHRTYVDAPT